MKEQKLYNRELSWLSFNHRVLQEAEDPSVPLYERIKFLAIFSSNLDEFFRVRVASLRNLLNLKSKAQQELKFDPSDLLKQICEKVNKLQEQIGFIFRKQIIPDLNNNNIFLINEKDIREEHHKFIHDYFKNYIVPQISPMIIVKKRIMPFLKNNRLYHAIRFTSKRIKKKKEQEIKRSKFNYAILEIPTNHLPRFIELPKIDDTYFFIMLDDIIRYCLPLIFHGYEYFESYSIKLTRDAELYIEDEFTGDLLEKIKKGIERRTTGLPCRFLYDPDIPQEFLLFLKDSLDLTNEDLMPGGRYHNFSDFMNFPNPGYKDLNYKSMQPLKHPEYERYQDKFQAWKEKDFLFHFPYQNYDYIVNAIRLASEDPNVKSIKTTQYRVAKNSQIVRSLIKAVRNGKEVTAFVEIKARFDEEVNIQSAEDMKKAGVKVLYSLPGIKVHAKMALITRKENGELKEYLYLATGNFNEKTARLYSDFGLITSDERLTKEAGQVFQFLEDNTKNYEFEHLLVAQFNMRKAFTKLIDNEIENAGKKKEAKMLLKMNSLEDDKIIRKLYEASNAGVKIKLIIRGICRLVPGVKGQSENIEVISIIDRFLEHSRVFIFHNGGDEKIYLGSADWMKRNLSRRVEVVFPIYNEKLKSELKEIIELQMQDNLKARIIDEEQTNTYKSIGKKAGIYRAQYDTYEYYKTQTPTEKTDKLKITETLAG
jgi:polyphosphate kinase